MWRRIHLKNFIMLACIFLASFLTSAPATATSPVAIGIVEDVTGYNADAGRAERDAAILCIEEWNAKGGINGRKIEYIFRDNSGDPTKATTIAKEFVGLGVVGVQGGTTTTTGLAEVAVFTPARIPYVMCSMSNKFWDVKDSAGKSYAFTFTGSELVMSEGWIETALNYVPVHKKAVILHVNILWGKSLRDTITSRIKEKYADKGIEVIGAVECELKATDLTKEVMRMKELNPDVVLSVFFPDAYVALFRGCQDLNYHPPNVGYWGLAESAYLTSDPKLLYNLYGYGPFSGKKKVAVKKLEIFKKRFGYTPVSHWAMAWDAMNVLLTAIKNVGTDGVAIREWMTTKAKGMPLLSGNEKAVVRFEEGSPYFYSSVYPKDYGIVRIDKNGKREWLD
jgi:branched-chain amino acid transport system substrate-binding protein